MILLEFLCLNSFYQRLSMEFIPLISDPDPTNLKSSRISKAWREIFNGKSKQKGYKIFYPRNLIKTSNKEQEKGKRDSNSSIYIILRINLFK